MSNNRSKGEIFNTQDGKADEAEAGGKFPSHAWDLKRAISREPIERPVCTMPAYQRDHVHDPHPTPTPVVLHRLIIKQAPSADVQPAVLETCYVITIRHPYQSSSLRPSLLLSHISSTCHLAEHTATFF